MKSCLHRGQSSPVDVEPGRCIVAQPYEELHSPRQVFVYRKVKWRQTIVIELVEVGATLDQLVQAELCSFLVKVP